MSGNLDRVDRLIADATRAEGRVGEAVVYFLSQPGKRIRARLSLNLSQRLQVSQKQAVELAAAIEMLHNASLVFDDVQDHDEMRRGRASVWHTFGASQAINLGIYFIAQANALAAGLPGVSTLFAEALRKATTGQAAEIDFRATIPTLAQYETMSEAKTGALFGLAARSAATLANVPTGLAADVESAFGRLGAAYQIQDDLADVFGIKGRGRAGLDLQEGKANSIVLFHLERHPEDQAPLVELLRSSPGSADHKTLDHWLQRFVFSGAVAATQDHLHRLCDAVISASNVLPAPFALCLSELAAGIREPAIFQHTPVTKSSIIAR